MRPGRSRNTSEMKRIFSQVLERVTPERQQVTEATALVKELRAGLKRKSIAATTMLGGSTAKGTFLKGDHDLDIFVRFNRKKYLSQHAKLSDLLERAVPRASVRIHGSRDYFQLRRDGYLFEIVPVLTVSKPEEARNVTDMSPLHVSHVLRELKQRPKLIPEIRLAKQFCKAAKVYGAESYINGFSGHVLDLLVIHYGSFLKLLEAASRWKTQTIIDPAKHHRNALFALNKSKVHGPLVLVDPIQPERNAAAALSEEKFLRFRKAVRDFLTKPDINAFTLIPLTPERVRQDVLRTQKRSARAKLYVLRSEPLEGKNDVVATKLLKAHEFILAAATKHGFTLLDQGWEFCDAAALHWFLFKDETLSQTRTVLGPPVSMKTDAERFRTKHKGAAMRGERFVAEVPRTYRTCDAFLRAVVKDPYVVERAKRVDIL
jgi:tRNA nucleotidyltransferase (CCA-adding enzyme)